MNELPPGIGRDKHCPPHITLADVTSISFTFETDDATTTQVVINANSTIDFRPMNGDLVAVAIWSEWTDQFRRGAVLISWHLWTSKTIVKQYEARPIRKFIGTFIGTLLPFYRYTLRIYRYTSQPHNRYSIGSNRVYHVFCRLKMSSLEVDPIGIEPTTS